MNRRDPCQSFFPAPEWENTDRNGTGITRFKIDPAMMIFNQFSAQWKAGPGSLVAPPGGGKTAKTSL
jgi:hypothetical protein